MQLYIQSLDLTYTHVGRQANEFQMMIDKKKEKDRKDIKTWRIIAPLLTP